MKRQHGVIGGMLALGALSVSACDGQAAGAPNNGAGKTGTVAPSLTAKSDVPRAVEREQPMAVAGDTYSIGVTGMTCGGCAKSVETTLKHLPGVSAAAVDLEAARARVTVNAGTALTKEQVAKALDDAGFGLSGFEAK
jgi:copper chaperone CopZ